MLGFWLKWKSRIIIGVLLVSVLGTVYAYIYNSGKQSEINKNKTITAKIVSEEKDKLYEAAKIKAIIASDTDLGACYRLFPDKYKLCDRQESIRRGVENLDSKGNGQPGNTPTGTGEQLQPGNMDVEGRESDVEGMPITLSNDALLKLIEHSIEEEKYGEIIPF